MTEEKMYYWLIVFEDNTTCKDFAVTPERAVEIQRTINNNDKPIKAVIRLGTSEEAIKLETRGLGGE